MGTQDHAEYMREYRSRNPSVYAASLAANNARRRAQIRLAREHPADFRRILNEERSKDGLPPIGAVKRGRKAA